MKRRLLTGVVRSIIAQGITKQSDAFAWSLFAGTYYSYDFNNLQNHVKPANNTPAFSTQLTIKPNSKRTINRSPVVGNDKPGSTSQWRNFNNLYGIFEFNDKTGLTPGFDIEHEQKSEGDNRLNTWYGSTIVVRFTPCNHLLITGWGKYYSDKNGVIISTGNDNFWWRTELRTLNSKDDIFQKEGRSTKNNIIVTKSFAIAF